MKYFYIDSILCCPGKSRVRHGRELNAILYSEICLTCSKLVVFTYQRYCQDINRIFFRDFFWHKLHLKFMY